ncbi:MAG: cytochrome c [Nitrospira defluvii]|nr:cytochrome c [Nitrospira defluvii]
MIHQTVALQAVIPVVLLAVLAATGCVEQKPTPRTSDVTPMHLLDVRTPIPLEGDAQQGHRAIMLQHLETIQAIVAALAEEDYRLAQGLTESHLGFFMHRHAMAQQQSADFPPAYYDLAMAHHEAAGKLADVIPSRDLKQILPQFNHVLKACVACHLEYKLGSS